MAARGFSLSQSDRIGEGKLLVQGVEFFEKTGPMGCPFIFLESDFDPSNSFTCNHQLQGGVMKKYWQYPNKSKISQSCKETLAASKGVINSSF